MDLTTPLVLLVEVIAQEGLWRTICMILWSSVFSVLGVVLMALAMAELIRPWWLWTILRLQNFVYSLDELTLSTGSAKKHQNAHKSKLQPDEPAYPLQIQDASRIGSMLSAGCLSFRDFQSPEDCEGLEDHSNPDIVGSDLMSLTINLLKARTVDLTPTDVLVIIVMIDTHCVALSATLSSKDALTSRSYVRLVCLGQALAWASVFYTEIRLAAPDAFSGQRPDCANENWFDSNIQPMQRTGKLPFRNYWITHLYDFAQPCALALCHSQRFNDLEKLDRNHRFHQEIPNYREENQTGYSRLPATAFSVWRGFALYPVALIVVVERHLAKNQVDVGDFREWGQSVTIITCACSILHWAYVNLPLVKHAFVCAWRGGGWVPRRGPVLGTNVLRFVAVGEHPSLVGEEDYKLLTAVKPE